MAWREFVDIEIIALVSKHVSGALAIIGGFLIIGLAANWAIKDPVVNPIVHYAETVIVTSCVFRRAGHCRVALLPPAAEAGANGLGTGGAQLHRRQSCQHRRMRLLVEKPALAMESGAVCTNYKHT